MSRDPYRSSVGELDRPERWDRDRFYSERERDQYGGGGRGRFEDEDQGYSRPAPRPVERAPRGYDDDPGFRERRYYDEEPRYSRPPAPVAEIERTVVTERERDYAAPPPRRPGQMIRRQSSLDTFDRTPQPFYQREEYGPPARREDFRREDARRNDFRRDDFRRDDFRRDDFQASAYDTIPLPRSRALPPPRMYAERELDEVRVTETDRYGADERVYPEMIHEKEVVRTTQRRERSRESRASRASRSTRSSSATSSSSSDSTATAVTVRSEYPKKGKTRIPARLVSKRALTDLNYPFTEEGPTIVVQKALGQDNIDDLLKLSEDYKKSEAEQETSPARAPTIIDIDEHKEVVILPSATPVYVAAPAAEVVQTTALVRATSPARSVSSVATSTTVATTRGPVIIDARPREMSDEMVVGPLVVAEREERHRSRSRHTSHRSHKSHRARSEHRELVRAERLSTGELVLYEEEIDRVVEPSRGVRIEKDKKGPPPGLMRAMLATLT